MKFLIDEQLPISLVKWLAGQGFDVIHATALGKNMKISDKDVCRESITNQRVVISKDIDFLNSFLIKKEPWKLIYLTTGNISNKYLLALFQSNLNQIIDLFDKANVVEMSQQNILVRL
ncbi:MAG: DUF5615 family PIN-like protein [Saprospiraceae bacterium]|nr:DUF5615 family PIN-like protein [Saprospiraceae bacterium]MCF8249111.1 DUF5615 family PIN-like protein [Saprospiraceae bacterium]MCF8281368.1 DUF5615 family PIN-like protein [Bacteroidales bacterium]MCF8311133.1 DUF5615 family PIN-like protein [Saprospiraceae bacterium]MCF8440223.1 DUF5615 family PIN-like protein [Saprospiraceae bacterium]